MNQCKKTNAPLYVFRQAFIPTWINTLTADYKILFHRYTYLLTGSDDDQLLDNKKTLECSGLLSNFLVILASLSLSLRPLGLMVKMNRIYGVFFNCLVRYLHRHTYNINKQFKKYQNHSLNSPRSRYFCVGQFLVRLYLVCLNVHASGNHCIFTLVDRQLRRADVVTGQSK